MPQNRQPEPTLLVRSLALGLPPGFEITAHDHGWPQLVFASGGALVVETDRHAWIAPSQRAVWVPAGVPHRLRAIGATSMRTVYLSPRSDRAHGDGDETRVLQVSPLLRELVLHTVERGVLPESDDGARNLARVLIDQIASAPRLPFDVPLPTDPRARRIADLVRAHPAEPAPLAELAAGSGASPRTVERIFRRETGLTFGQWRRQLRLLHGTCRLAAGDTVTAAALAAGYDSTSAFIAVFRDAVGETPGRFFRAPGDTA